jgi:hypothetical protein
VRLGARLAVALLAAALLLGLYNDFAIRWRVADSLADRTGLRVRDCRRITSLELQSKNFFSCSLGRSGALYRVQIRGRCWTAVRGQKRLHGCLSPWKVVVR